MPDPHPVEAAAPATLQRSARTIRWTALGVILLLIPLFVAFANRFGIDPSLVHSPLLGKPAPAFDLQRLDGVGRVTTADLAGRVFVVNFWASWCVPCRQENRELDRFTREHAGDGVRLIGVVYNDKSSSALQFREELGGTWPLVVDPGDRVALDYGVRGVPETFIIDANGVIVAKFIGAVTGPALDKVIAGIGTGHQPVVSRNDQYRTSP